MIRVLVVEDSRTVRERLVDVLRSDPELEVVGEAQDGKQAIERCQSLRPDVITMDMMLPVMTGLAATEYIMAHFPTPILIVSSSTNRGELFRTYEALAAGAVDVLEKPGGDEPEGQWETNYLSTLKLVSRIRVITHLRGRSRMRAPQLLASPSADGERTCAVVGIGASTGGPGALVEVLQKLPSQFSLPVLLVLHIGEPFGRSFAEWLQGQIGRSVAYAVDGEVIAAAKGRVLMAPPDYHLAVRGGVARLTSDPERHSCRPSVDVLFESLAIEAGASTAACLLTGMGRDGATGLLAIHRAGGLTIAQDEATSVVWGMPREAALLGAATHVLPLPDIGPFIATLQPRPTGGRSP
ncbi:MAG TPA: chemotaxis-specific protein-glutamate methyltransferase CheB [Polyangia bacterium]|jgi:two-component system chemotaxis response regulator CheB|nr:chemotaxis-specific protein-glutamate methyltransferase CheB [Polyangia bacterium]